MRRRSEEGKGEKEMGEQLRSPLRPLTEGRPNEGWHRSSMARPPCRDWIDETEIDRGKTKSMPGIPIDDGLCYGTKDNK